MRLTNSKDPHWSTMVLAISTTVSYTPHPSLLRRFLNYIEPVRRGCENCLLELQVVVPQGFAIIGAVCGGIGRVVRKQWMGLLVALFFLATVFL